MKRLFTRLLVLVLALALTACGGQASNDVPPEGEDNGIVCPAGFDGMEELLAAARAEGELTVCGSCEEAYLAAACQRFEELFGIRTTYQYVASGSVQTQSQGTPGHPAADVWFGGSAEDCAACGDAGLLAAYDAVHASHLTDDLYRDAEGLWYGISVDPLGFVVDRDMLKRMAIDGIRSCSGPPTIHTTGRDGCCSAPSGSSRSCSAGTTTCWHWMRTSPCMPPPTRR